MQQYLILIAAGALGSFHCVGMCGGFVCALGAVGGSWRATVPRLLMYNTARVTVYVFLGGLGGLLGGHVLGGGMAPLGLETGQRWLAGLSGILILAMGLELLGWLPRLHRMRGEISNSSWASAFRATLSRPGLAPPIALGTFNGFLPCPLVYAFLAQATAMPGPFEGMAVMGAFGLGTFPVMLASGVAGRSMGITWRRIGVRMAGGMIVVIGTVTLLRAFLDFDPQGAQSPHVLAGLARMFTG